MVGIQLGSFKHFASGCKPTGQSAPSRCNRPWCLEGLLEHLKQAPPLDQDSRLRRWRDPDGITHLLFKCDQAVVERTGLVGEYLMVQVMQ